jgi:P-type E1-E2 ATPase
MISVNIPGRGTVELHHLVLDFNGTFALDGKMLAGAAERLSQLADMLHIYVVTGDTNGTARDECRNLPVTVKIITPEDQAAQKSAFVRGLQPKGTACVGNGANDEAMFEAADIAFAVIGGEGCFTGTLLKSDIAVQHPCDAFDLLLKNNRLIATLRR